MASPARVTRAGPGPRSSRSCCQPALAPLVGALLLLCASLPSIVCHQKVFRAHARPHEELINAYLTLHKEVNSIVLRSCSLAFKGSGNYMQARRRHRTAAAWRPAWTAKRGRLVRLLSAWTQLSWARPIARLWAPPGASPLTGKLCSMLCHCTYGVWSTQLCPRGQYLEHLRPPARPSSWHF